MTDLVVTKLGVELAVTSESALVASKLGIEICYNVQPALVVSTLGIEICALVDHSSGARPVVIVCT